VRGSKSSVIAMLSSFHSSCLSIRCAQWNHRLATHGTNGTAIGVVIYLHHDEWSLATTKFLNHFGRYFDARCVLPRLQNLCLEFDWLCLKLFFARITHSEDTPSHIHLIRTRSIPTRTKSIFESQFDAT